jgi:multidrug efflux pump
VIGGMLTATVLAVFLVPVFFVSVRSMFGDRPGREESPQPRPLPPQSPPSASER